LPKKFKIVCHHDLESGIEEPYSPHKYREKSSLMTHLIKMMEVMSERRIRGKRRRR